MTNKTMQETKTNNEKGNTNMTTNKSETKAIEQLRGIEKEFNEIFEKRESERQAYADELERAEDDYKQALEMVEAAEKNIDIEEIIKAENQRDKAKREISLLERKVKTFDTLPLIKEAEYKEFDRRIKDIVEKENDKGKEKISKMMKEMAKIRDEYQPVINETNELLKTLQTNLLKNDASMTIASGKKIPMDRLVNKYDDYSLIHTVNNTINQPLSQNIMSKY